MSVVGSPRGVVARTRGPSQRSPSTAGRTSRPASRWPRCRSRAFGGGITPAVEPRFQVLAGTQVCQAALKCQNCYGIKRRYCAILEKLLLDGQHRFERMASDIPMPSETCALQSEVFKPTVEAGWMTSNAIEGITASTALWASSARISPALPPTCRSGGLARGHTTTGSSTSCGWALDSISGGVPAMPCPPAAARARLCALGS